MTGIHLTVGIFPNTIDTINTMLKCHITLILNFMQMKILRFSIFLIWLAACSSDTDDQENIQVDLHMHMKNMEGLDLLNQSMDEIFKVSDLKIYYEIDGEAVYQYKAGSDIPGQLGSMMAQVKLGILF